MKQEAILFTKNNIATIADHLTYDTVESLMKDYGYMLETHETVVLARDILDDGVALVSYVVTQSSFKANQPSITLNDKTFTFTYEI